jgi:glycosyltransferase involved in cell wall biosynthesis
MEPREYADVAPGSSARKTVLLVGNFLSSTSGIRFVCEDLAEKLATSGWSVISASNRPNRLSRLYDMSRTAWRERHRYSVAHVEVYSGPAFLWAEMVCRVLRYARKPFVLTLHGGNLPLFAQHWPTRVRQLLHSAQVATTPSPYLLEQMRPYRDDLYLLPNALHVSAYPFHLRVQARPRLVWLRAFQEFYKPEVAVMTVALLAGDFPDIELTMFGPDRGSLEYTQEVAGRLGIADRVRIVGPVPKATVPSHLAKHDVFLNTTTVESFGVSVVEAAACGLPIVTTDVGGLAYIWEHEHDALLVPPDDPEAMATAIRRVLTEPGLAERLSRNARHKAEQFDWANILPKWEHLLMSVAAGHTP